MTSQVKIRFSKTGKMFFKDRKYEVTVNGSIIGHIASNNPELDITLPEGNHSCEVRENAYFEKKDFNLKPNQLQTVTINPSSTPQFFAWLCTGFVIAYIVAFYFIFDQLPFLNLLGIMPIILFLLTPLMLRLWKKNEPEEETFGITMDKEILNR